MQHGDSKERSSELLRLALPLMSRQAAGVHPVSYALWYEYVSQSNPRLRRAVDAALATGALDEARTLQLYETHVAPPGAASVEAIGEGIERVAGRMSDSAAQAEGETERVRTALEAALRKLSHGDPATAGGQGVVEVQGIVAQIGGTMASLKQRLQDSRQEIEVLRQEVARAEEAALVDSLTGLANRRAFDLALEAQVAGAQPGRAGLCLLMADIDHFKQINDSYGHLFGDKVLRAAAQIFKGNTKANDLVARYGGEEFAFILPDTPLRGAETLAERIRGLIEGGRIRQAKSTDELARVTISFGVAEYLAGEATEAFVKRADAAMYASKARGRNRITLARAGADRA
jgi:diguanylate cyclase